MIERFRVAARRRNNSMVKSKSYSDEVASIAYSVHGPDWLFLILIYGVGFGDCDALRYMS